ncbi:hypothetical protein GCM10010421_47960 [Streptomyces glaucus]|uniref:FAD-binding domain-containing protein n=2 Tax=Streptomyces glaucus TaxID=284029 RepID=A0ABP5XH56_9ACTN
MDTSVVIAGAGPAGLMLAGESRLAGIDVTVLESLPKRTGESRGIGLATRAMEMFDQRGLLRRRWGPLRLYPPGTFAASGSLVEPVPARERAELARWPLTFRATAPRVRVPVRLTFAEYEAWWRHDEETLADLAAHFTAAPRVIVDRQPDAGHDISLGWAARSYHLRALAFFEGCLASRAVAPAPAATTVS